MPDLVTITGELEGDVARLVRALRHSTQAKLVAPLGPGAGFESRAAAVRALLADVAALAQGIEEASGSEPPTWHVVPEVAELALGDQLAVLGHDLLAAVDGRDPDGWVWTPAGRRPLIDAVSETTARLHGVRALM